MAAQSLLNSEVDRGSETLRTLDSQGLDVSAAFWLLDDDTREWKFVLAERTVDKEGPRRVYEKIANALSSVKNTVLLRDVFLVASNSPFVLQAATLVSTGPKDVGGIWFTGNSLNGVVLPDMYIYRMTK
jgi:hypothetical protein